MSDRACKATTKAGTPCKAAPLKEKDFCSAHDPDTPESIRFGSHAQAREAGMLGGRPPLPKPTEVARELVEESVEHILAPHFRTLGLKLVRGDDGRLHPIIDPDGGAKIFGESKEGDINMTGYDDLGAHIAAAEKLLDRVYGRPKQATEITGADGGPLKMTFAELAGAADAE